MKKTLAILIAVLLVVSMFGVFAACQPQNPDGATEYTITFRDFTGKQLAQKTTKEGKVTQEDPTREGYNFDGWWVAASDSDLYGEKVDLASYKFTKDTDLYAKWTRKITAGEAEGYALIGGGAKYGNWDTEAAVKGENALKLTQDANEVNKYSITWDVEALEEFKVITALGKPGSWDLGEINIGGEKVTSITKAAGVTYDPATLFDCSGNIKALCKMNVTLTLVYAGKTDSTIELKVNSIPEGAKVPSPVDQVGYGIMGTFAGQSYKELDGETALTVKSLTSELRLTANETKTQYSISLTLKANDEFIVRVNEDIEGLASYKQAHRVDLAGATLPTGVTTADLFKTSKKDAIVPRCDMTVDVVFYANSNQIAIKVKAVTLESADDLVSDVPPVNIMGSFNTWSTPIMMTPNGDFTRFTKTDLECVAGTEFKIRKDLSWDIAWNVYNVKKVTLAAGVTVDGVTEDNAKEYFVEGKDNITIKVACTITVEVDYNSGDISITVTSVAPAAETPDPAPEA